MKDPDTSQTGIGFFNRISVKVTLIILAVLSLGIGSTIAYYLYSQNSTIISSREDAVREEANVIFIAIKNTMLAGEAPLAVNLFNEFSRIDAVGDIGLFRKNGVTAFSDNKTLNTVNDALGEDMFKKKKIFLPFMQLQDERFTRSVKMVDDVFFSEKSGDEDFIVIYKPLINQPKCSSCHGTDHVVRGVVKISSPITGVLKKTRMNIVISAFIYAVVVFTLLLVLTIFLRMLVIRPVFRIGEVVRGVGKGDFNTKIPGAKQDELGHLANQINDMIDGLHERFKLARFVSKSTLEHVKGDGDIELGGEKKEMTVLFSDIRSFTNYSENKDPHEVMIMLNDVMNLQGEIIHEFDGDIDKFVGDEIMAVFEGEDMAIRALKAAHKIREKMKLTFSAVDEPITVGIGINTGEMISGNMGSGDRLDRTVIGDAVNLGARLCSIAGKNTIILSEFTWNHVKGSIDAIEHDAINVKGKEKAVKIYTLRSIT